MPYLLFKRDLILAFRRGGGVFTGLAFALMAFSAFAFGLGAEALHAYAAQALGVIVLLSCLIALPALFERDYEDGALEQYLLQQAPPEVCVFAKLLAFWLTVALPPALLSPLLGLMAGLSPEAVPELALTLIPGTLVLASIGMLGAALTLGMRGAGLIQALILLPLYVPVLIFMGSGQGLLLCGLALVAAPVASLVSATLLKLAE